MLSFFRRRRARTIVEHVRSSLMAGLTALSGPDRAAVMAISNALIDVAAERWGAAVANRPMTLNPDLSAEIVVALSESHERVFEERLEPIANRGMDDIAFAQSMRQLRAYEVVIATLGAAAADKSSGSVVGEAWKLLWLARENAAQGAEELRRFSKFADADPVPRSKKLRRRAELADLVRLSTTLPAFFLKKPAKRKAS